MIERENLIKANFQNGDSKVNSIAVTETETETDMDVYNMYVGDCASTYRNNMFRDYEKHPYGTFEGNGQQPQQQRKSYYTLVQGNSE